MTSTLVPIEHAWRYFELHANQRIAVFNYFLFLSGALATGLAASLQGSQKFSSLGIVLGTLLTVTSFIFWKLDQRVSFLIKHAESALSVAERSIPDERFRLFHSEPTTRGLVISQQNFWTCQWSYGASFRAVFWGMGIFGASGAALSAMKFFGALSF